MRTKVLAALAAVALAGAVGCGGGDDESSSSGGEVKAPAGPKMLEKVGEGEGQVPIKKVSSRLTRMRPVLTKEEASVVNKRLKSLGGMKPPIPKGVDPTRARVDRKAMRGK